MKKQYARATISFRRSDEGGRTDPIVLSQSQYKSHVLVKGTEEMLDIGLTIDPALISAGETVTPNVIYPGETVTVDMELSYYPNPPYWQLRSGAQFTLQEGQQIIGEGTVIRRWDSGEQHLRGVIANQPYPLLFATISGAHLYGFPSPDSDYDLRGAHILPVSEVVGLNPGRETIEVSEMQEELQLDLVTHDIKKFFSLLLKKNGYVLEQLYSPLIVHTTPEHEELKAIAKHCITRHHSYHYLGFATTQWRLFEKERPRRVKPLLYVYRVLLTGIYLMQTGIVEANLIELNKVFNLPYIPDLISRKVAGQEQSFFEDADIAFYCGEYEHLSRELEKATESSRLPEKPSGKAELNDLLLRSRMAFF